MDLLLTYPFYLPMALDRLSQRMKVTLNVTPGATTEAVCTWHYWAQLHENKKGN